MEVFTMIFTYNELLLKYKSAYQIEKAVRNCEIYKIEKGIYSDISNVHHLEVIMKKYSYGIFTSYSAYYYHNLTDVIPNKMYLATNRNATTINSDKIQQIRMKDELYNLGKTEIEYEGIKINIYDKERMLIDLARNKNQIGYDLYKEIIANYRKQVSSLDTQKIEEYLQYFVNGDKIFEIIQDEVF
jgi:predicted transcriptional regulator of viral defense system